MVWAWVVGVALAGKPVDLTPALETDSQFSVTEELRLAHDVREPRIYKTTSVLQVLAGGRLGEDPLTLNVNVFTGTGRREGLSCTLTMQPDRTVDGKQCSSMTNILLFLIGDQIAMSPVGRHRTGETWTQVTPMAFFQGPLEVVWTLEEVKKKRAKLSGTANGKIVAPNIELKGTYTVTLAVEVDLRSGLPDVVDSDWTFPGERDEDPLLTVRILRTVKPSATTGD